MGYRANEIPELAIAKNVMSKAEDIISVIDELNEEYFSDKDYKIEIFGNFCSKHPLYSFSLTTKGFGFDIFEHSLFTLNAATIKIQEIKNLLERKELGKFILNNLEGLAKENFAKVVLKG